MAFLPFPTDQDCTLYPRARRLRQPCNLEDYGLRRTAPIVQLNIGDKQVNVAQVNKAWHMVGPVPSSVHAAAEVTIWGL